MPESTALPEGIKKKIALFVLLAEGESEIAKAEGKDIVIVFGKTGSGKSTFIKDAEDHIVVAPDSKIKELTYPI